ncbi:MAG: hypothetical protein AAFQ96_09630, partial [Pseudomonadota bacterium]
MAGSEWVGAAPRAGARDKKDKDAKVYARQHKRVNNDKGRDGRVAFETKALARRRSHLSRLQS